MTDDKLPGTENMKCAIGLYEGSREYVDGPFKGTKVYGIFSYVDVVDEPCHAPVRFWCKRKGSNHAWLACANPEHQRDAETVLKLTPEYIAFLVWQQKPGQPMPEILRDRVKRDPFLDSKKLVEAPVEPKALPKAPFKPCQCGHGAVFHIHQGTGCTSCACPTFRTPESLPKKRIPRNKKQKKPRTLAQAIERLPPNKKREAYKQAGKAALRVFAGVMGLVDKEKS